MKLHPLTVPYRTTAGFLKYGALLLFLSFGGGGAAPASFTGAILLAFVLLAVVGGWHTAYYNRFEYRVTDDTIDITSGVVSRRSREIPLDRVQNVDVRENVVQRALGIAQVNLETAGGDATEADLRYLGAAEARQLQEDLRRRKRGDEPSVDEAGSPVEDDVEALYEISPHELLLVSVFSLDLRLIAGVLFLSSLVPPEQLEAVDEVGDTQVSEMVVLPAVAIAVSVVFVLWLIGFATTLTRYYDFRLTRRDDTLLYERGLFNRYSGSIPLDKVQTVSFSDDVFKRTFGYSTLAVDTAGYSPSQSSGGGSEVAVPLAKRERVLSLARRVEDFVDLDLDRPPKRARRRYVVRYVLAAVAVTTVLYAVDSFYVSLPQWYLPLALSALAPVAAHLKWGNRGYQEGKDHVVTRNGFWSRTAVVVPYYRVQTVSSTASVLQRRWSLASLTVDTAGTSLVSSNDGHAVDYDLGDVDSMRERVHEMLQDSLTLKRLQRERSTWRPLEPEQGAEGSGKEDDEDGAGEDAEGSGDTT